MFTKQEPLKLTLAFDKRLDHATNNWVGVVLRNLPPPATAQNIHQNFGGSGTEGLYKILHVQVMQVIKGQKCAIIQLENITQAQNFCKKRHGFAFTDVQKLKAHIHPLSSTVAPEKPTLVEANGGNKMAQEVIKYHQSNNIFSQQIAPPFATQKLLPAGQPLNKNPEAMKVPSKPVTPILQPSNPPLVQEGSLISLVQSLTTQAPDIKKENRNSTDASLDYFLQIEKEQQKIRQAKEVELAQQREKLKEQERQKEQRLLQEQQAMPQLAPTMQRTTSQVSSSVENYFEALLKSHSSSNNRPQLAKKHVQPAPIQPAKPLQQPQTPRVQPSLPILVPPQPQQVKPIPKPAPQIVSTSTKQDPLLGKRSANKKRVVQTQSDEEDSSSSYSSSSSSSSGEDSDEEGFSDRSAHGIEGELQKFTESSDTKQAHYHSTGKGGRNRSEEERKEKKRESKKNSSKQTNSHMLSVGEAPVKRPRGRPRKNPLPTQPVFNFNSQKQ